MHGRRQKQSDKETAETKPSGSTDQQRSYNKKAPESLVGMLRRVQAWWWRTYFCLDFDIWVPASKFFLKPLYSGQSVLTVVLHKSPAFARVQQGFLEPRLSLVRASDRGAGQGQWHHQGVCLQNIHRPAPLLSWRWQDCLHPLSLSDRTFRACHCNLEANKRSDLLDLKEKHGGKLESSVTINAIRMLKDYIWNINLNRVTFTIIPF